MILFRFLRFAALAAAAIGAGKALLKELKRKKEEGEG